MKAKVDKKLLPMKAHYFLFNAGTAPVVPFMPTFARQLEFSSVVVGTMYTILPVVGMLAKPLFGFISDRYQKHRSLFLFSQALTAIAFFCIMLIPSIQQDAPLVEFRCHSGGSHVRYCSEFDNCIETNLRDRYGDKLIPCKMHCPADTESWEYVCKNWINETDCPKTNPFFDFTTFLNMNDIIVLKDCLSFMDIHDKGQYNGSIFTFNCPGNDIFNRSCEMDCGDKYITDTLKQSSTIPNSEVVHLYQFWLFFLLLIISWAGMSVVVSVGDAICFSMLGERHYLYGNQRLWGAIGWGIFSIISGVLVDTFSGGSVIKDYTVVFWLTLIIIGLDMLATTKLEHTQTKLSSNILKDVGTMFLSLRIVIFFIWCIAVGLCTALIWNFLFWHLEDLGGCDSQLKTLEGFAMGIQCFGGELPFFFLSGWILKKIGHINAMSLVLLGFGVRFLLYSFLTNPWWVLPIELMNGLTFGIFYATMASYASIVAPPGTEATLQGLVGAIFEGIGVSIGSFIGGLLFGIVGGSETFRIFGICAICAFFLHVLLQWLLQKYSKNGKNNNHQKTIRESDKNVASQNNTERDNHTNDLKTNDILLNTDVSNDHSTSNYLNPSDAIHMLDDQEYNILPS